MTWGGDVVTTELGAETGVQAPCAMSSKSEYPFPNSRGAA